MKEKVLHAIKRRSGRRIAWINAEPFWLPYIEASPGTYLVYITVECVIMNDSWGVCRWKGLSASLMRGTLHDLNKMWASLASLLCKGGHRFENNVEYLMVLSRQHKQICALTIVFNEISRLLCHRGPEGHHYYTLCLHRDFVLILHPPPLHLPALTHWFITYLWHFLYAPLSFIFLLFCFLTLLAEQRYCGLCKLRLVDDVLMLIAACCSGLLTVGSCWGRALLTWLRLWGQIQVCRP